MIKFFRHIRKDLMETGKTGKYLKYAIGEIILVVIGILIALSINNWNDGNKNAKIEQIYYCRILDDFELDKQLINELENKANARISLSKELLLELDSGTKDKNYLLNKFLQAVRSDAYAPRSIAFNDLVSSGNLKLLNDDVLKTSLVQYYSDLENKKSQLKQNRVEKVKKFFELTNSSINFGAHEFDYVKEILGPEIIQTLPQMDWTKDKNSQYYQELQQNLVFNITMADREKQHLSSINKLMESSYKLLVEKCENTTEK